MSFFNAAKFPTEHSESSIPANFKGKFIAICILALMGMVCPSSGATDRENCLVRVMRNNTSVATINVEVAVTPEKKARGLMYRTFMPEENGMLFVFDVEQILSFWMKNTRLPLSIAFIDRDKRIISIQDMKPMDETILYNSPSEALYALETNQGWFSRKGVRIGDKVDLNGCISK